MEPTVYNPAELLGGDRHADSNHRPHSLNSEDERPQPGSTSWLGHFFGLSEHRSTSAVERAHTSLSKPPHVSRLYLPNHICLTPKITLYRALLSLGKWGLENHHDGRLVAVEFKSTVMMHGEDDEQAFCAPTLTTSCVSYKSAPWPPILGIK